MHLDIIRAPQVARPALPVDKGALEFGRRFTPHMFTMCFGPTEGWIAARVEPYHALSLDPSALVFHYGQEIFEGMKAYAAPNGSVHLFRPDDHILRFNRSARRVCMPEVDVEFVRRALSTLVDVDRAEMPQVRGSSLYLRPTMIATSVGLGVRASDQFLFFCIVSPVGAYFGSEAIAPVAIHVSENHVRAVRGGVGEIKVGGNYAASLLAAEEARDAGCVQTLWLDAIERKYVEEVGTMNVFFVFDDVLVTPALTGTILAGMTRDSVLRIAQHEGRRVEERTISLAEVLDGAKSGRLKEAFGSGTAVGISPIGALVYRGTRHAVRDGSIGPIAQSMHGILSAIQRGESPLFPEWRTRVDEHSLAG